MRTFGPKQKDHPSIGQECQVCHKPFKEGDFTTLVSIGTDDPEERQKAREGRSYISVAVEVHAECAI